MNQSNKIYFKSDKDLLLSLLADEAKNAAILDDVQATVRQMRAKSGFRLALINTLLENQKINKGENK